MEQEPILNNHNKQEYPPMHTVEHILNATMIRMYNCGRAVSAHIERKKSKCDYSLPAALTDSDVADIENAVNAVINQDLQVTQEYTTQSEACEKYNLSRLPDNASDTLRIVHIGDYDACPCAGVHVEHTSEIGNFQIISHSYNDGIERLRFKLA